MIRVLGVFVGFITCSCVVYSVRAVEYYDVHDEELNFTTGIVKNYGTLNGLIHILDDSTVYIQNYGQINSPFDYGTNIFLTQQITSAGNLRKIDNLTGFDIKVSGAQNINMSELVDVAEHAMQINLENSYVIVDSSFQNFSVPINIEGNSVTLCVSGNPENWLDGDVALVSNITGQTPFVQVVNNNPMYAVQPNLTNGTLYVNAVRQTNYSIVTSNQTLGEYLNQLQNQNPDDPLVQALNNANSISEVNNILAHSPRTNPIKLMNAVKTINSLKIANSAYTADFGVFMKSGYVLSDDFSYYNMNLNLTGEPMDNLAVAFGVDVGRLEYSDVYSNANSMLYGGNLGLYYNIDDYFVNLFGAFSYAQFYDIDVFGNGRTVKNPHGTGETIALDSGVKFWAFDMLDVVPFVGIRLDKVSLLNDSESDVVERIGFNLKHNAKFDENFYSICLNAYAETNETFYIGLHTNVVSTADAISGGVGLGVLYDDMGWTYQISANAKFLF